MKKQQAARNLEGRHVVLRPITVQDCVAVTKYTADPRVTEYLPWRPIDDQAVIRLFLQQQQLRWQHGTAYCYAVIQKDTNEMIGAIDLMGLRSGQPGNCELGYVFRQDQWGKGYATDAAQLLIREAFNVLNILIIDAYADIDNIGSHKVMEKIGMQLINTEQRIVKNEVRLYYHFAIARSDFSSSHKLGVTL